MFSVREKRLIADQVQKILRATAHPELPDGEIQFHLHVDGKVSWSWADINNNGSVPLAEVNANPHNEFMDLPEKLYQVYGESKNWIRESGGQMEKNLADTPISCQESWIALARFIRINFVEMLE